MNESRVRLYVFLLRMGRITLDKIPVEYRDMVESISKQNNAVSDTSEEMI